MLSLLQQKLNALLLFIQCSLKRPAMLFPAVLFIALIGLAAMLSFSASSEKINPYLANDLPLPTLPLPYSPDELAYYDSTITAFLQRHRFNGTVLVARRGMIIYQDAFGYADFRDRTPHTPDTPFQLASISKTFTATAVLMLQEDGLLNIDDPVNKHIPEFPYPHMTIRHLLSHTSGIQNYMWLVERYWKEEQLPTNEDVLVLFNRYPRPVNFSAGTRFEYSNTGYAFLALVVERVSGKRFSDFLESRIFVPLQMTNTFAYNPNEGLGEREHRALGFRPWRRSFIYNGDQAHDGVMGDKGLYSSVVDLYKWDQAIYSHSLLPRRVWEQAFEPALLQNQRTVNYGQGWRLQTFLDGRIVHHPGRWGGFRTSFKRFIDNKGTLIMLSNNDRDITPLVEGMQNIIFQQEILLFSEKPAEDTLPYEEESDGS